MNEIIRLVKESFSMVNDYGDTVSGMESRTVFATLRSVGQKEFYEAAAVGLKPEIVFVLEDYLDYQDEQIVLYKPFRAKSGNVTEFSGRTETTTSSNSYVTEESKMSAPKSIVMYKKAESSM